MSLADRRPETYRNIPVLRLRVLVWGYILQSAQRNSPRSKTAQGRHVRPIFKVNTQLEFKRWHRFCRARDLDRREADEPARATWIALATALAVRTSPITYGFASCGILTSLQCLEGDQVEVQKMNDASPRFAKGQAGAASLLSSEEGNLRLAEFAQHAVELNAWVTEEGLRGATAGELFEGYCRRLSAMDFVIMRAYVSTQTLHPQWTGYGYTWRRELKSVREQQFARGPISQEWLSSPFIALIQRSLAGEKNPWLRRSAGTRPRATRLSRASRLLCRRSDRLCVSSLSVWRGRRFVARDRRPLFFHD